MRYSRHLLVDEFTQHHQQKLADASVVVVGAGGLGSALLMYLAAAGVGHLGIIDFDVVSESNLNRQVLYNHDDIDLHKADRATARIRKLNPTCRLSVFNLKISNDNATDILRNYDVVADATDNFATRYALDDACRKLHKPFVYGTAEQWTGQVSVFHYGKAGGYRDLYPDMPTATQQPPGVMGPMPGVVGTRQALEVIKIVTGLGEPLAGKLWMMDTLNNMDCLINI
ncbi:MAG: HesA/MoeB/ThiF family protein [Marinilabiliaceae bacterium]|nr:HesA/MoeB/ThiF family protein [Marinilabiliaceae bacterium]